MIGFCTSPGYRVAFVPEALGELHALVCSDLNFNWLLDEDAALCGSHLTSVGLWEP